jgi:hypothetical protein
MLKAFQLYRTSLDLLSAHPPQSQLAVIGQSHLKHYPSAHKRSAISIAARRLLRRSGSDDRTWCCI